MTRGWCIVAALAVAGCTAGSSGPEAAQALDALVALVQAKFDEE